MTSGAILVELVASDFAIAYSLFNNSRHVVSVDTVHYDQVLNKKAVFVVPPTREISGSRVEQVSNLFVINLKKTALHKILGLLFVEQLPDIAH